MAKNSRIDNPAVREYLYKFVPEKLNENQIFVRTFGEGFASRKVKQNILYAYTNENVNAKGYVGYHNGEEKAITICSSGENDSLLTPEDIANNTELQDTALHEAIHAILVRSSNECRSYGIMGGTGLLEKYQNGVELGRGMNEGYTVWMCKKAGYDSKAYPELTKLIELIELSIGTEKTMELGKGGIKQRFAELLGISRGEVEILLARTDQLYIENDQLRTARNLSQIIGSHILVKEIGAENVDGSQKIEKKYKENLVLMGEYYFTDPQYKAYLLKTDQVVSDISLKGYFDEEYIPKHERQRNEEILEIESFIINRYFIEDLKRIFESDEISKADYINISKIASKLSTNQYDVPEKFANNESGMILASVYAKQEIERMVGKYLLQVARENAKKFKEGKLELKSFIKEAKDICGDNAYFSKKFVEEFSKNAVSEEFSGEFSGIVNNIWKFSDNDKFLDKMSKTLIYKLEFQDSKRKLTTNIAYDKENFYDRMISSEIVRSANEKIKFDYTLDPNENDDGYKTIMENFTKLQKEVFSRNPNAKIHIVSRTVVVQENDEQSFYFIDNSELVPMKIVSQIDIGSHFYIKEKEANKEETAIAPIKVGFFPALINRIKRKLHERKNKNQTGTIDYIEENEGKIVFNKHENIDKLASYRVTDFDEKASKQKSKKNIQKQNQLDIEDEQK